jgi:hypothetical protein
MIDRVKTATSPLDRTEVVIEVLSVCRGIACEKAHGSMSLALSQTDRSYDELKTPVPGLIENTGITRTGE